MVHYPVGTLNWAWLNYRINDHLIIDLWRYAVIILAFFAIGVLAVHLRDRIRDRLVLAGSITHALVGMFIILQEVNQLGKPMLVWRLPFATIILVSMIITTRVSRDERGSR